MANSISVAVGDSDTIRLGTDSAAAAELSVTSSATVGVVEPLSESASLPQAEATVTATRMAVTERAMGLMDVLLSLEVDLRAAMDGRPDTPCGEPFLEGVS
jgi:hypothetical protein